MKVRRPWFKFYVSEWLANRKVALMSPACKGVYIDLLALCWQEGAIPADPDELAFLLRLPRRQFFPLWDVVKNHFSTASDPHFLTNSRIESEKQAAEWATENARKAANSRYEDPADAVQEQCDRTAIQKQKKKEERESLSSEFDFQGLYDRYPLKKGKDAGLKKLRATVKTEAEFQRVKHGLECFLSDERRKGTEIGFYPHFSTWVNKRRWLDYEPPSTETAEGSVTPIETAQIPRRLTALERIEAKEAAERANATATVSDARRGQPGLFPNSPKRESA